MSIFSKYLWVYFGYTLVVLLHFFSEFLYSPNTITKSEVHLLFLTYFDQYLELIFTLHLVLALLVSSDLRIENKLLMGAKIGFFGQIIFQILMGLIYYNFIIPDSRFNELSYSLLWQGNDGSFSIIEFLTPPIFYSIFIAVFVTIFLYIKSEDENKNPLFKLFNKHENE